MFVDFDLIKKRLLRKLRNLLGSGQGALYATSLVLRGKLEELKAHAESTAAELRKQAASVLEADDQLVYLTVGQAISYWAQLEEALVILLSLLLGTDLEKAGLILYSTINFNVWIGIIDELFAVDDVMRPLKPKWNKIASRLRALKDERDRIAHHSVRSDEETLTVFSGLRPAPLDVRQKSLKYKPMGHDDILAFTGSVNKLARDVTALAKEMYELRRQPSSEKSPE